MHMFLEGVIFIGTVAGAAPKPQLPGVAPVLQRPCSTCEEPQPADLAHCALNWLFPSMCSANCWLTLPVQCPHLNFLLPQATSRQIPNNLTRHEHKAHNIGPCHFR